MQEFVKRAKEYIETLDTEDPTYDFIERATDAIEYFQNLAGSNTTDAVLSREANLITIASRIEHLTQKIKHVMENTKCN